MPKATPRPTFCLVPTSHGSLDCYPYTFSPLLLFAPGSYFDKGYSNYNSVAQFFASALEVNMLENVLYDRKNMLYEDLLEYVTANRMLVTCCIDAHFTAIQIVGPHALVYYDPLKSGLGLSGCPPDPVGPGLQNSIMAR